jgi:L-asparaginase
LTLRETLGEREERAVRVRVLTTGGTIASRSVDSAGHAGVVATDGPSELLGGIELPGVRIEAREVLRVGGYRLAEADLRQIASAAIAGTADAAGVVVTHGTDTMEESAFLTDLMYAGEAPIVFCGAQRHAGQPDRDGPRNLADALRLAAAPQGRGVGVMICMAGHAWPARYAAKTHTVAADAFSTPMVGPVAALDGGDVRLLARPVRPRGFPRSLLERPLPRVDIVTAYAGVDGALVRAAIDSGARGLVIAAFGAGNVTPALAEAAANAVEAGVPVLVVSRCGAGPVIPQYGGPGGGAELARAGAIFGGALRPSHARLLLALALATTAEPRGVAEIVLRHA